ncbi:hypothetical protein AC480_01010 [miscellaneous Crenarchaeota group archaeon SMTZ1-55]|nr:MAG: hypothetical protein AC480_01010 [miscellaneous Crenarchaeota group archaeon SMTZ1-55]
MPRGPSWWFVSGYGYPYGWRCRWFPWLPRWWWTGLYGPITPYAIPQEQEIALLDDQAKTLEQALEEVKRRLEELKKTSE